MSMIRARRLAPLLALVLSLVLAVPVLADAVLEVAGPKGVRSFTLAELKKLRSTTGLAGTLTSAGRIARPTRFRGVALADVLAAAGGMDAAHDVAVAAADGYRVTFTPAQVAAGDFTAFDPVRGDTLAVHEPLTLLLAWEHEGRALDPADDGPLRLVVVTPRGGALVDAHLSVKNAAKITLVAGSRAWRLELEGAHPEAMDQATFESGAAPNCHGVTWKDAQGRSWTGIPLWLLVGRVDDDLRHGAGAYADSLAAGSTVELAGAGGQRVSLPGERVARNDRILLAHRLDGAPLPAASFPLRLVGADLQPGEELDGVVRLTVRPRAARSGSVPAR